jgi:hypothetical protein
MLVHEIFPNPPGHWPSGGGAGTTTEGAEGSGGVPSTAYLGELAPSFPYWQMPGITGTTLASGLWPIDFITLPLPPVGRGFEWIQPGPPPSSLVAGGVTVPAPGGILIHIRAMDRLQAPVAGAGAAV